MVSVDQIVPLRDQIINRTAGSRTTYHLARMAKRNAAIHTASALFAQRFLRRVQMEFAPVGYTLRGQANHWKGACDSINPVGFP